MFMVILGYKLKVKLYNDKAIYKLNSSGNYL